MFRPWIRPEAPMVRARRCEKAATIFWSSKERELRRPRGDDPPTTASPGSSRKPHQHVHFRHLGHGVSRTIPPSCLSEARLPPLLSSRRVSRYPTARCHTQNHTQSRQRRAHDDIAMCSPPTVLWLTIGSLLQAPTRPRARDRSSPTSMPVSLSRAR